jgi:hypothetical protein
MTGERDLSAPDRRPGELTLRLDCAHIIPHSLGTQGKTDLNVLVI